MNDLPKGAHPTAKAFFDALDRYNQQQETGDSNNNEANTEAKSRAQTMSESLKRKTQQLGWRNRHSQNEYYPLTVLQGAKGDESDDSSLPKSQQRTQRRSRRFSVRQVQRGEVEGTYGTGATVWPAALVLIKYLEHIANNDTASGKNGHEQDDSIEKPDLMKRNETNVTVRGAHVLDLGAGTGVTSIAAALLGATSVVCTDGEESVVGLARDNIRHAGRQLLESSSPSAPREEVPKTAVEVEINEKALESEQTADEEETISTKIEDESKTDAITTIDGCPILTQKYWWGAGTSLSLVGCPEKTDGGISVGKSEGLVIMVADCVLPKLYPIAPLVQAIDECFRLRDDSDEQKSSSPSGSSSSVAILSYEHRYYPDYNPRTEFRRLASERRLDVFTVPKNEMDPVYSLEDVELWIVRRRQ